MIEDFAPTKMAEGLLARWNGNAEGNIPCSELLKQALDQLDPNDLDILASSACAYVWLNTRTGKEKFAKEIEDELEGQNM